MSTETQTPDLQSLIEYNDALVVQRKEIREQERRVLLCKGDLKEAKEQLDEANAELGRLIDRFNPDLPPFESEEE